MKRIEPQCSGSLRRPSASSWLAAVRALVPVPVPGLAAALVLHLHLHIYFPQQIPTAADQPTLPNNRKHPSLLRRTHRFLLRPSRRMSLVLVRASRSARKSAAGAGAVKARGRRG
ncbi:hypothetical protein CVT25_012015 [Psilocybe cyanescens]|uniref:Uncharacterized protein n=1 Tax=Psilocybe cyanescens TaxID=93625 RepID=A0A409VWH8_PSICY|nr:hypothetical protein CVT25_012015 [Psilocybe cyanescens]